MSKQRRLGKGIDALLQGRDLTQLEGDLNTVQSVPIGKLRPNPDQPRKSFAPEPLAELARSIEERGIIQPILAEEQPDGSYVIIAGERRFRAAEMAGLTVVPVLPGEFSEDEKLEIALIENIQREDLNPIEEAQAFRELLTRTGMSQEELSGRLGISRPALANSLRLLKLPESVLARVSGGELSAGHARTLLALEDETRIGPLADRIVREDLSVRIVERAVALVNGGATIDQALTELDGGGSAPPGEINTADNAGEIGGASESSIPGTDGDRLSEQDLRERAPAKTVEMQEIEQRLMERLGTRVTLQGSNDRGKIEISYLSMDDLDRLVELVLGRSPD